MNSEMASSSQLSCPIEVERKFVPGTDVEKTLHGLGAVLLEKVTFRDSYYDSPDVLLTLADFWLRKRDDTWELKHPPKRGATGFIGGSTQYVEVTQKDEIIHKISEELGVPCAPSIEAFGLNEFASFVTCRRRFQLPLEENAVTKVVVDLDKADFGFVVGEVEVLVKNQEEVQNAMLKVEEICRKLGSFRETPVQGKVSTFLQLHRPEHYKKLMEAHKI
ncbi:thiamine-triphosphatase isoform X2 [Hyperolius riggenbachi]|uniref:thiamine-triphosphatase isoform X2 n=1 Tax=Hyperolius riggenbachi TaxID=752182 RepID=UPI0035A31DA8